MTRINTNVPSLVAQNRLRQSNNSLQESLTRLSTGLRINSGSDDPAGLIASEALRSEITGLNKAISNTQRASQIISTADSALGQVSSLLNDVRGLVVEAANNGALSDEEISANQLQIDSSLEAINRIAQTTTFQGRKLLDGSLDFVSNASSVSGLSNASIDQANLGATGRIDVDVNITAAATQANVNAAAGSFDTEAVAASATFGTGNELVTVEGEASSRPAELVADSSGFASASAAATASINVGANNTIDVSAPSDPTTASVSVDSAAFSNANAAASVATITGDNSDITVTAQDDGAAFDGLNVTFVDDSGIGDVAASAAYDEDSNTITVTYNSAATTATNRDNDAIVAAINTELTNQGMNTDYVAAAASGADDFGTGADGETFTTAGGVGVGLDESLSFELTGSGGTAAFSFADETSLEDVVTAINAESANTNVQASYDTATDSLTFTSTDNGANALVNVDITEEAGADPFTSNLSATSDAGTDVLDYNGMTIEFNDDNSIGDTAASASVSGNTITVTYNSAAATATNSDLDAIVAAIGGLEDFSASLTGTGTVPFAEPSETISFAGGVNGDALTGDLTFDLTGDDGTQSFSFTEGTTGDDIATAINEATASTGVSATFSSADGLTLTSAATGSEAGVSVSVTSEGTGGTFESSLAATSASGVDILASSFNGTDINFVDALDATADDAATATYDADTGQITVNFNSLAATSTNRDYDAIVSAISSLDNFSASLDDSGSGTAVFTAPALDPTLSGGVDANTGLNGDLVFQLNGADGAETFNFGTGTTGDQMAAAINLVSDSTGVTASYNEADGLAFTSSAYGSDSLVNIEVISEAEGGTFTGNLDATRQNGSDIQASINGVQASAKANTFSINTASLDLSLTVEDGSSTDFDFSITGGGAKFQLGPDVTSNQQARLGIGSVSTGQLGGTSGRLYELGSGQAKSLSNDASGAAKVVDEVINKVTSLRGRLGAFQATTLESNLVSLNDTVANLQEAESSIRDADFAAESAKLTRSQILVQSGTNVLALANQNPQNVLSLLG